MTLIPFTKVQGCGNDFLLIDTRSVQDQNGLRSRIADSTWVQRVCDRRYGVGADGILLLAGNPGAWSSQIINADGTDGGMCGNGLRCIARYLVSRAEAQPQIDIPIEMGGRTTTLSITSGTPFRCGLNIGEVRVDANAVLSGTGPPPAAAQASPDGFDVEGHQPVLVWAGNPHAVVFVSANPTSPELVRITGDLRRSGCFGRGVNVSIAKVHDRQTIEARTDERGVGPTLACASGACAIAVGAHQAGMVDLLCTVRMPGGDLGVALTSSGENGAYMAELNAGAEIVYEGQLDPDAATS